MSRLNQKVVFAAASDAAGSLVMIVGIPEDAWEYMREGKTHTFDLTKSNIPVKMVMYGGKDHTDCMRKLEGDAASANVVLDDRRRDDFSIPDINWQPIADAPVEERLLLWLDDKVFKGSAMGKVYTSSDGDRFTQIEQFHGEFNVTHFARINKP